jgi:hypothetical protein
MNFSIKDANGSDLNIVRLSITPDGFEIVVGDDIPQSFLKEERASTSDAVATQVAAQNAIGAAPSADDIAPGAKSLFGGEAPAPEAPAPESENLFEVDADGVVWDDRIHSSSKKKTAKGIWAKRKNLPDGLYDEVMAQLKTGATKQAPTTISQERPTPNASAPDVPDAPAPDAVPDAPAAPEAPDAEAPLPEGNQVGDANDSGLASVLAQWGN